MDAGENAAEKFIEFFTAQIPKEPLFRSVNRERELNHRPLSRVEVFLMIKRRARAAGLPAAGRARTTIFRARNASSIKAKAKEKLR